MRYDEIRKQCDRIINNLRLRVHMATKLSPLKTPKRKLKQKEKNWVLDCINQQKSKLQPYSSIKDKYLKYFVVRVPKKKRNFHTAGPSRDKENMPCVTVDPTEFRKFLSTKKQMILESQATYKTPKLTGRVEDQQDNSTKKEKVRETADQPTFQSSQPSDRKKEAARSQIETQNPIKRTNQQKKQQLPNKQIEKPPVPANAPPKKQMEEEEEHHEDQEQQGEQDDEQQENDYQNEQEQEHKEEEDQEEYYEEQIEQSLEKEGSPAKL